MGELFSFTCLADFAHIVCWEVLETYGGQTRSSSEACAVAVMYVPVIVGRCIHKL